uniref:Ig-like domain-containing protein n=1 Tax=Sinocyclocheilus rhinocerous TaxID=307959 RepID=A0A673MBL6_9TELE
MLQRFYGLVYLSAVLLFVTLTGTQAECPVQLNPQRAVVRYGDSVAVNCSASVPHKGMGWEASEGAVTMTRDSLITWRVSNLIEWDIQPYCYINHEEQCQVELPVTIYKTPDSVSISIVNHRGPMIEGKQYELQCDVHDVAPVQNLTVKWYKGQTLLNQTTFTEDSKTPVNETTTLLIRPDRADDGAQYRCEAELELGAEGPQPPPKETSDLLNITVLRAPSHYLQSVSLLLIFFVFSFSKISNKCTFITADFRVCKSSSSETPDSVSIIIVNHRGPMIEGKQYELQCDVHDVAPVQNLTVKWYKGQTLLNQTTFTEDSKTPVNETTTLLIRPDRADDGAQYRCEAELELGAEGPQPPPKETSDLLNITVYCK